MRFSALLRIASDPITRVWSGLGDLDIPADIVEPDTARYIGGGALVSLPELAQVLNGTASRVDIALSGVTPRIIRMAQDDAATVKNAKVHIGIVFFDADWQITDVEWVAVLRCFSLTTAHNGTTRSVSLSIGTEDVDRAKAPIAYWTDADQRKRSPTDQFFDHVSGITAGTSRRFGPNDA